MKNSLPWIGLGLVTLLTCGGGVIHGRLSNRWGPPEIMIEAGAKLQQIPSHIGSWEMQTRGRLPDLARSMLECTGDLTANYLNATSDEIIGLTLMVGPAGTISAHSPEICFPSQNFQLIRDRRIVKIRDSEKIDHQFWLCEFRSQDLEARLMRVYYAWSTGGAWSAPSDARIKFAGSPYLYKLQLVGTVLPGTPPQVEDPGPSFLRMFLPEAGVEIISPVSVR